MKQTIRNRLYSIVNSSQRKCTLFACSCVREIWYLLKDERSKQAIIAAENYVDGLISKDELTSSYAAAAAAAASYASSAADAAVYAAYAASYASSAADAAVYAAAAAAAAAAVYAAAAASNKEQVLAKQHQFFDDIFGS